MRIKVIKEIKGLVPGDILYYNDKTDRYEITKTDYDFSDNGQSVKSIKIGVGSYTVEGHRDYFVFIDDEDNEVELEKISYIDFPEYESDKSSESETVETPTKAEPEIENKVSNDSQIIKLQEQIKELEKKLEDIERGKLVYNMWPFRATYYT